MKDVSNPQSQILYVTSFQELVSTPFNEDINAICWTRNLVGDFAEIVKKVELNENIVELNEEELLVLQLSEQGQLARDILINDLKLLIDYGASPMLNLIRCYDRDDSNPVFPTDVYSLHIDRSPVPSDTFLCTYYGESSELVPNSQAIQKILIPEIRNEIKKIYHGGEDDFDSFLIEHFFDLHYQTKPHAHPISLGPGNLWKLAVDYPKSLVLPCIHRAPLENTGETRLLLIC